MPATDSPPTPLPADAMATRLFSEVLGTHARALRVVHELMSADDYDDRFLRPTTSAFELAWTLAGAAAEILDAHAAVPAVSPIGDGGLVLQWGPAERYVRVLIPPDANNAYVYAKDASLQPIQKSIDPATLEALQRRLTQLARE